MLIERASILAKIDVLRAERGRPVHKYQSIEHGRQEGELNALTMIERMLWSWPEEESLPSPSVPPVRRP